MFAACMLLQSISDMYGLEPESRILEPAIICMLTYFFVLILPFNIWQRNAREALIWTIISCFKAPFEKVAFRHFFFADVMCSASVIFQDFAFFSCFITVGYFNHATNASCPVLKNSSYFLAIIPLWIRFLQCLRRLYDDRTNTTQAYNAGKYATGVLFGLCAACFGITGYSFWY